MDFYTIDFETANSKPTSACSIGIVGVRNKEIVLEKYFLINPKQHFEQGAIQVHKLTPDMVEDAPTFDKIWPEIKDYFNNSIVFSHSSQFDFFVLKALLEKYDLPKPNFKIGCTLRLAELLWTKEEIGKYSLDSVAAHLEHDFNHHNALEDARVCALLINRGILMHGVNDVVELHDILGLRFGKLGPSKYYHPFLLKHRYKKDQPMVKNKDLFDKLIVLSGTPKTLRRKNLVELLLGNGAYVDTLVSARCDIFIKLDNCKESKLNQVNELIDKGNDIKIMDEIQIMKLVKTWK